MIFKNATILDEHFHFVKKDLAVHEDRFAENQIQEDDSAIDCTGKTIIPGLIDIHTHGCAGCDNCDGTTESLQTIAKYQASNGITSFLATTMTLSEEQLGNIFEVIGQYMKHPSDGAYIQGINMEGPFLNPEKRSAKREIYPPTGHRDVSPPKPKKRQPNQVGGAFSRIGRCRSFHHSAQRRSAYFDCPHQCIL